MNEFDNINGFLIDKGEKVFNTGNRSYKYGDGLFETMKVVESKVVSWNDHYERLKNGLKILKIDDSGYSKEKWEQEVEKVIYKNHYRFAKLRLSVYRDSPGLYTPMANKMGFVIEGVRFDTKDYSFKSEGITLGVYDEIQIPIDILSNCKTSSALPYVMASIVKKERGLDDVLLYNSAGNICESANSNVFLVKNNVLFTPALDQGCVAGVMRKKVIHSAQVHHIELKETALTLDDFEKADEIFLTNAIAGIQGVRTFCSKEKSQKMIGEIQSFF